MFDDPFKAFEYTFNNHFIYGIKGYDIHSQDEFNDALADALNRKKPAVLNCFIGMDEKVLPMVAPGAAINDMIFE